VRVGFHEELEAINALTRTDFELADDDRLRRRGRRRLHRDRARRRVAARPPDARCRRSAPRARRLPGQHAPALGTDAGVREWGLRMLMVSRCIERIGDHAVDIGEEMVYLVTAELREFTDASHA
jgi:hypothetical protein